MIVGRSKGMVSHSPSRWKDDKISNSYAWGVGLTGQHSEDRGILKSTLTLLQNILGHIQQQCTMLSLKQA